MSYALVSWSGGKDSALALHRATSKGLKVLALVNFVTEGGGHSLSHGLSSALLASQAEAMGIPLVQQHTTWGGYEDSMKEVIQQHREKGAAAVVFGDIYLQEHETWLRRVCNEAQIEPVFPLWGEDTEKLFLEFVNAGFSATVVSIKEGTIAQKWLRHVLDAELLQELKRLDLDPCGEKGEYHTFVTAGPLFKRTVNLLDTRVLNRDGHWFLDILSHQVI